MTLPCFGPTEVGDAPVDNNPPARSLAEREDVRVIVGRIAAFRSISLGAAATKHIDPDIAGPLVRCVTRDVADRRSRQTLRPDEPVEFARKIRRRRIPRRIVSSRLVERDVAEIPPAPRETRHHRLDRADRRVERAHALAGRSRVVERHLAPVAARVARRHVGIVPPAGGGCVWQKRRQQACHAHDIPECGHGGILRKLAAVRQEAQRPQIFLICTTIIGR